MERSPRLLGWFSLAFLAGTALVATWGWPGVLVVGLGLVLLWGYNRRRAWLPEGTPTLALALAICLGALRYQSALPTIDPFHIAWFNDRSYPVWVTGSLAAPPDRRDRYANLQIETHAIDTGDGDLPVQGLLLARVDPGAAASLAYGQQVRLYGFVQTPPENETFSYRDYLARQGVYAYMPSASLTVLPGRAGSPWLRAVYAFKARALEMVYRLYPDPEASLLAGILLGEEHGLSGRLQQAFKDTGTSHIIAISGFNIAIIAGIFVSLFSRLLGARSGAIAAALAIAAYTILVGADAAVVRAALMGGTGLLARELGRRQDGLNTLFFVGGVMGLHNPFILWDVGFQLSFAATLGLILYGQPLQTGAERWLQGWLPPSRARQGAALLSEYILLTFAAQLTTLPIMAWHFQRISLVSFVANPFILPPQSAVMILGGLSVLGGLLWFPLGRLLALVSWPFVAYTIRLVEWFASWPHGVLVLGALSPILVLLWYLALFTLPWSWPQRHKLRPGLVFLGVALLAWLSWRSLFRLPDGRLHVTLLDVGSAEALLITTPNGAHVLINGGASPSALSDALGRQLPPFHRQLDALVVANPAAYQIDALPVVTERYPPAFIWWGGGVQASGAASRLYRQAVEKDIPLQRAASGDILVLDDGVQLQVLDASPRGLTLLLQWQDFRLLLPIGSDSDTFTRLDAGRLVGKVSALLLADSGHQALNPPDWLNQLNPQLVLLSVSAGNPYGLPHAAVLESLQGYSLLRTDQFGSITLSTDGQLLWIESARSP